tara:strand:+ start:272 stop:457 length:186 start_codon:yes stop_codon:yes gene_type:complete
MLPEDIEQLPKEKCVICGELSKTHNLVTLVDIHYSYNLCDFCQEYRKSAVDQFEQSVRDSR